jgi:hypothetical protein
MLPFPYKLSEDKVWEIGKNIFEISTIKEIQGQKWFESIEGILKKINQGENIKSVIIDTVNGIMIDREMNERNRPGWDKWMDLAGDVYELVTLCNSFKKDLIIYLFGHVGLYTNIDGEESKVLITNGRKLEKIRLETKLPIVLFTSVKSKAKGKNEYKFETRKNRSTAKTPLGMFADFEIPNSLKLVDTTIRLHYGI